MFSRIECTVHSINDSNILTIFYCLHKYKLKCSIWSLVFPHNQEKTSKIDSVANIAFFYYFSADYGVADCI